MKIIGVIDWHVVWTPSGSLLEVFVRGTVIYLGLLVLFRLLRRDAGTLSMADLLLVVLVADAAQNGMAGEYRSVTEGLVLVGTIAGWSYLLDWASYRFKPLQRLLQSPPLPLVRDGVMLHRNMRRELITADELRSRMREQGIARLADVRRCYLEPDGQISMIAVDQSRGRPAAKRPE